MNTVPLTDEDERDPFGHEGAAVLIDGDVVLKLGDAPRFGGRDAAEDAEENREQGDLSQVFQITNFPIPKLQNFSEFDLYRLPVGRCSLKKLPLGKSEHSRQYVRWEGLNLRVQIAYHRVVVAAGILNLVFRLA